MSRNRSQSISRQNQQEILFTSNSTENDEEGLIRAINLTNNNNNNNGRRWEGEEENNDSAYSMETIQPSTSSNVNYNNNNSNRRNSNESFSSTSSSTSSSSSSSQSNSFDSLRPSSPPPSSQATPRSSLSFKRNLPIFNLTPASPRNSFSHHTRSSLSHSNPSPSPYLITLPASSTSSTILHLGGDSPSSYFSSKYLRSLEERKPILYASLKAILLFLITLVMVYALLRVLLPPIEEGDWEKIKIPKSFEDLKGLNEVLQIYKQHHYYRVLSSYILIYLFIQCFSIPGSMYMSIVAGSLYGVIMAVPLVCFCVATGALLCYTLSSSLGPAILLNSAKWQSRVDKWKLKILKHESNLISYLIILRISPLPPHWVVNLLAPHLGISILKFWTSTFFGIGAVSFIHCQIGSTLDEMSGSEDFKLVSWQNILGLCGVILAVLIPVLLRSRYKSDIDEDISNDESFIIDNEEDPLDEEEEEEEEEFENSLRSIDSRDTIGNVDDEERGLMGRRG